VGSEGVSQKIYRSPHSCMSIRYTIFTHVSLLSFLQSNSTNSFRQTTATGVPPLVPTQVIEWYRQFSHKVLWSGGINKTHSVATRSAAWSQLLFILPNGQQSRWCIPDHYYRVIEFILKCLEAALVLVIPVFSAISRPTSSTHRISHLCPRFVIPTCAILISVKIGAPLWWLRCPLYRVVVKPHKFRKRRISCCDHAAFYYPVLGVSPFTMLPNNDQLFSLISFASLGSARQNQLFIFPCILAVLLSCFSIVLTRCSR